MFGRRQPLKKQPLQKADRTVRSALWLVLVAGILLLTGSYIALNVFRYTAQMDSDIAAEALNARAIWEHRSLIPKEFYPSTETRILNVNLIGALFYGLTGDMNLSMGLACSVMLVILVIFYAGLLRNLGFQKESCALGMLLLLALPGNLRHAQLLFVWADYYAIHCIIMLVTLRAWLSAIDEERGWKIRLCAAFALSFVISLSGLRAALICYAPLMLTELIRWLNAILKKSWTREFLRSGSCALGCLTMAFCGSLSPTAVGVPVSRNLRNGVFKLWQVVLPDVGDCVGIGYGSRLRGILLLVLLLLSAVSIAFCLVRSFHGEKRMTKADGKSGKNSAELIFTFFILSLGTAIFMGAFTTTDSVWRYYFMVWFAMSYGLTYLLECFSGWGRYLCILVSLAFSFLVWDEELLPVLRQETVRTEWTEITDWMQENGYYYGYSTYDTSNAMTGACNGNVQVSAVAELDTLEICKWLTDRTWYVPEVSENTKAAYIIPRNRMEEFQVQLDEHADLILVMETESYYVYAAPHNYTCS